MKIFMQLVYEYMSIFFTFPPTSNHIHPPQVKSCDSNSPLVVDEYENGKFRLKMVNNSLQSSFDCLTIFHQALR